MPKRHLRYGDSVTVESTDGNVVITKGKGGNLTIDAPHARVHPVARKIKHKSRLQPNEREKVDFSAGE